MSSAAQPLKQAHRESPICTGLRIRTLLQKLISRLMLLFNVASSKLWIKLLACRWQVTMLDLQVLSGNQSRHSCNQAALSQACSPNGVQWQQDSTDNVSGHRHLLFLSCIPYSHFFHFFMNHKYQWLRAMLTFFREGLVHKHTVLLHYAIGYGSQSERPADPVRSNFSLQGSWDGQHRGVRVPLTVWGLVLLQLVQGSYTSSIAVP